MIDFNLVDGIGSATESNPLLIDKLVLVIEGTTKIITKFTGAVVSDYSGLGDYIAINFNDTSDEAYTISKIRLMDTNGNTVAESPELSLVKEQGNSLRVRLSARFPGAAACTFYNVSINIPYATKNSDGLIRLAKEDEVNKSITVYSAEDTDALIQDNLVDTSHFVSWDSGVLTASQLNLVENYNSPNNPVMLNKSSSNDGNFLNINNGYIGGNAITNNPAFDENTDIVATPQVVTANYISQLYSDSVLDSNDEATNKLVSGAAVESYVTDRLASIDTSADMQEILSTLYVHKSGNTAETITGAKTFTDSVTISGNNKQLITPSVSSGEYTGDGVYNIYNSDTWISSANLSKIPTINAIRSAISSINSSGSDNTEQLEEALSNLSDKVNTLKSSYNFADVVATKEALNQLSTTNLLNNDKVLVLVDNDADGISTVYRLVKGTGGNSDTWTYFDSIKTDSYTKSAADSTFIKTANLAQSISSSVDTSTDVPSVAAVSSYIADRETNYYNKTAVDGLIANVQSSNVNDATLTIKKNASDVGDTFTANASSDKTINLDLATVASTGSYNDLSDRPTIPTDTADLTNGAGYLTQDDITDLNPGTSNYSFADDPNVPSWVKSSTKPTYTAQEVGALPDNTAIPTVNNASLTIKKNANDAGTEFTANASTDVVCNLGLATVATSGDYGDLSGTPTFKTINGESITGSGAIVITGADGGEANVIENIYVNNVYQTPDNKNVNITVPTTVAELTDASNYVQTSRTINNKALSSNVTLTLDDVADGSNRSIPTVNNSTITIKKNSSDTGDNFTTNASSAKTINLGLHTVATSGSYNDLDNKPTIPTVNNATLTINKGGTDDTGSKTFTANASSNVTINLGLSTVASSGSYNDLSDKPTIPTIPTNHVTTDTTQTITAAKTFNTIANDVTFTGSDSSIAISDGAAEFTSTVLTTNGAEYDCVATIKQEGVKLKIQPALDTDGQLLDHGNVTKPAVSIGNSSATSADFEPSLLTLNGDSSNKYVVKPSADAGADLGESSNRFDNLYVKNIKATGTILPVALCQTDASTAAKYATLEDGSSYTYTNNTLVLVHFSNTNYATNPTLRIAGDTRARPIFFGGTAAANGADPDDPNYESYLLTPGHTLWDSWIGGETILMLCRYGRYYIMGKMYSGMGLGIDTAGNNIAVSYPRLVAAIDARRMNSAGQATLYWNTSPIGVGLLNHFYDAGSDGEGNVTAGFIQGWGLGGVVGSAIRGISYNDQIQKNQVPPISQSLNGVGCVRLCCLERTASLHGTGTALGYSPGDILNDDEHANGCEINSVTYEGTGGTDLLYVVQADPSSASFNFAKTGSTYSGSGTWAILTKTANITTDGTHNFLVLAVRIL